jgi:tetratricopeptide (TPR) repeat protein
MPKGKELCARDLSILNLIFEKSQFEKQEILKPLQDTIDVQDCEEGDDENVLASKLLEIQGIKLTESSEFAEAMKKFNEAIDIAPKRPSVYNNRAQLYRFMEEDESESK